jgi:hypothetical protein
MVMIASKCDRPGDLFNYHRLSVIVPVVDMNDVAFATIVPVSSILGYEEVNLQSAEVILKGPYDDSPVTFFFRRRGSANRSKTRP